MRVIKIKVLASLRECEAPADNQVAGGAASRSATEFGASIIIFRSERVLNLLSEDFPGTGEILPFTLGPQQRISRGTLTISTRVQSSRLAERSSSRETPDSGERSVFTTQRRKT